MNQLPEHNVQMQFQDVNARYQRYTGNQAMDLVDVERGLVNQEPDYDEDSDDVPEDEPAMMKTKSVTFKDDDSNKSRRNSPRKRGRSNAKRRSPKTGANGQS